MFDRFKYLFTPTRQPSAGAQADAFHMYQQLPPLWYANGAVVYPNRWNPHQPPQVYQFHGMTTSGLGGLVHNNIYGQPLGSNNQ